MDVTPHKPKVPSLRKRWSEITILFAGGVAMLLGLTVLVGWYAHLADLIQIRPQFAPMQYNTAVGILLAGAGLCAFVAGWKRLMQVLGGLVALLGILTLLEYLFNTSLGLDQLWFQPYITEWTSAAGRMSPVAAISFGFIGLALLIAGVQFVPKWRSLMVGALASVVASLCVMAVLGYIFGLPGTYGWGEFTRMALHTGCGIGLVSLGVFVMAWNDNGSTRQTPHWLPVPTALAGATASLILWMALAAKDNQATAKITAANAIDVKNQIETQLQLHVQGLTRMAERWEYSGRPSRMSWEEDATNYFRDFGDFQAIEWVDPDYRIRWVVPLKGNEDVLNRDLNEEARRHAAINIAKTQHQPVITRPVQLAQGGAGFIIYTPIYVGTQFDGFIVGVFQASRFFEKILSTEEAKGNSITISAEGKPFYEWNVGPLPANAGWVKNFTIKKSGASWTVRVWPSPKLAGQLETTLPRTILMVGLIVSGLIALVAGLLQKTQREIIARKKATARLQHTLSLQDAILNSANYAIISTDTEGLVTTFNATAERWLGYRASEIVGQKTPAFWHDANEVAARAKAVSDKLGTIIQPGFEVFVAKARLGGVDENEWTLIRKNGERFPVSLSATALTDEAGRVTGFLEVIADITERKKVEGALRESEERLSLIIRSVRDYAILMLDPDGRVTSWNLGAEKIKGYREEEIIGQHFSRFYPPAALAAGKPEKELADALAHGQARDEGLRVKKDGSVFYANVLVTAIFDEQGRHRGFVKVTRDITEQHRMNEKLQDSLELIRDLQKALDQHAIVAITDAQGKITYANQKFCAISKYSGEELIGQNHRIVNSGLHSRAFFREMWATISQGQVWRGEVRNKAKDGSFYWVDATIVPFIGPNGRPRQYIAVRTDITPIKRIQEGLRVSEERFRQAFNGAPIGMALVSPSGGFLKVNHTIAKMLGYSESELLEMDFQRITHPEDLSKDLDYLTQVLAGKMLSYQMEKRYLQCGGGVIHAMLHVSLVRDDAGEPLYFVSQIQDISDRKLAEQKMIESLREKEALLREIHHRVKNNMQVISSLLRLQTNYIKDAETLEMFRDCQNRIRSMALVHEKLYRSEGLAQVDSKDYLESLISLIFSSQSNKSAQVRPASEIARVMLDVDTAIPLGLIINELVSNSLKHAFIGQAQGRMLVSLQRSEANQLQLVVADDGKGLPDGFTPDKTDSLGLRLVKILTSQIKGHVTFENEGGAKVTITFCYNDTAIQNEA